MLGFLFDKKDDQTDKLISTILEIHKGQMDMMSRQLGIMEEYIKFFTQPVPGTITNSRPATEQDFMDSLELAAEMGNQEAVDLIADPDKLSEYLRHYRASV